jgi:hypothetical protein
MEAATKRISTLLNATDEITAAEVHKDMGIPYSCLAQSFLTTMLVTKP